MLRTPPSQRTLPSQKGLLTRASLERIGVYRSTVATFKKSVRPCSSTYQLSSGSPSHWPHTSLHNARMCVSRLRVVKMHKCDTHYYRWCFRGYQDDC